MKKNQEKQTKFRYERQEPRKIYVKNPEEPMTRPQKHIIINKRTPIYTNKVLREYISAKYDIPFEKVDLQRLTKEQAQDLIVSFKPVPKNKINQVVAVIPLVGDQKAPDEEENK